jgi:hypothetical protein
MTGPLAIRDAVADSTLRLMAATDNGFFISNNSAAGLSIFRVRAGAVVDAPVTISGVDGHVELSRPRSFSGDPISETELTRKSYVDDYFLRKAGDEMTGDLVFRKAGTAGGVAPVVRWYDDAGNLAWIYASRLTADGNPSLVFRVENPGIAQGASTVMRTRPADPPRLEILAEPEEPLDAVNKAYVDSKLGGGGGGGDFLPLTGGMLTGQLHIHRQTTPQSTDNQLLLTGGSGLDYAQAGFRVPAAALSSLELWQVAGSARGWFRVAYTHEDNSLTGHARLALVNDPIDADDATTKRYVDALIGAGGAFLPLTGGEMTGPVTVRNISDAANGPVFRARQPTDFYADGKRYVALEIQNQNGFRFAGYGGMSITGSGTGAGQQGAFVIYAQDSVGWREVVRSSVGAYPNPPTTYCLGASSALTFETRSDRALKTDIAPIDPGDEQAAFDALRPMRYRLKDGDERLCWGMIAQDIEQGAPDAVSEIEGIKHYDLAQVLTIAVAEIKRLRGLIETQLV